MGTGSDAEVTVYSHKHSPFAQRVTVALAEKGISANQIIVDFSNKPKGLLEANPLYAKVPTLVHNGKPVAESVIILEYLEDAFPQKVPLMPKDAFEKSKVRFWADYAGKGFSTVMGGFSLKAGTPEQKANNEEILKFLKTVDEAMASYSSEGPFFTGEKFGYVDVILSPLCCGMVIIEKLNGVVIPGPDKLPRFHKWIEAASAHPSITSSLPTGEENYSFVLSHMQKRAAAAAAAASASK